ncbi:hypothetical protein THAOC_03374 [Thalassiosira oceanica]|uniref:Uncharacterized protein n=1 Tax=Thalassiosira oceanica TaxID=159749 RepID=K0TL13_THAOC|nr:hypothetical protein THAOC_03374 [Thalassiosira oceanica]|eukprot:EJK74921.1 hypothetical protein THAOC_03374 [Thalassiosira oceanica]
MFLAGPNAVTPWARRLVLADATLFQSNGSKSHGPTGPFRHTSFQDILPWCRPPRFGRPRLAPSGLLPVFLPGASLTAHIYRASGITGAGLGKSRANSGVGLYIDEEWEYLRQCKVGARKSEQDEESRISQVQVLESGTNVPTIQAELDGAPVPVDMTMEEFADAIPSR